MELLQLQYFERIAKYQSMSRAAEELHVSQPSLSSCIIRLEKELGVKLFDRNGRKIVLNSYGKYFLNMTRQILNLVNECKVPTNEKALMERINIGFMNYNEKMFSLIGSFSAENPEVGFNVHGSTMSQPFAYSAFDFIIGLAYEGIPLFRHELTIGSRHDYVIVPKNHPLAEKESIAIEELKDEKFCFLKDEDGGYESEYKACVMSGFIPKCAFVTNDAFYKLHYISQGNVFGFIPNTWKEVYEKCDKIVLIPEAGNLKETATKLYWSDATLDSEANRKFLSYVKEKMGGSSDIRE